MVDRGSKKNGVPMPYVPRRKKLPAANSIVIEAAALPVVDDQQESAPHPIATHAGVSRPVPGGVVHPKRRPNRDPVLPRRVLLGEGSSETWDDLS